MEEIWKDIEGFEGYYQASSFGNIKNDNRMEKKQESISTFQGKYITVN